MNKKVVGYSLLAVACVAACALAIVSRPSNEVSVEYLSERTPVEQWVSQAFKTWGQKYEKSYGSADESSYRQLVFRQNLLKIKEFTESGENSFNLSLNEFADQTQEEFRSKYLTFNPERLINEVETLDTNELPDSVNHIETGYVNAVKNQGSCGSCWAFSTIVAVEGLYAQTQGELKRFSEQQLVDCDKKENQGCNGGFMIPAFEYIIENGIEEESNYPYKARDQKCAHTSSKWAYKFSGYKALPESDQDQLRAAVASRVVAVAIEVNFQFQFYSGGVFDSKACKRTFDDLNHGVAIVGYGSENGKDFWLVRNSWGAGWGSKGYIKVARQTGKGPGTCGIAIYATYPTA